MFSTDGDVLEMTDRTNAFIDAECCLLAEPPLVMIQLASSKRETSACEHCSLVNLGQLFLFFAADFDKSWRQALKHWGKPSAWACLLL